MQSAWESTRSQSAAIVRHAQFAGDRVQSTATTAAVSGGKYAQHVGSALFAAFRKWQADDAGAMAASVAYYLALSLFPMLLLLTSGLGLVFRYTRIGQDAEVQILAIVAEHCSPTLEQQVREVLSQLRVHSVVGGPFGLLTATLAAIGVFYQFERAFDRIWRMPAPADKHWTHACVRIVKQRLSAFVLLTGVGASVMLIMSANIAIGVFHTWMSSLKLPGTGLIAIVEACMTLVLNAMVFAALYKRLPKRRIHWMDAFRGGLIASLIWEGGRQLLGAIVIGVRYTAAYGAIGSFIALLLWCYWGVSIIFLGAEYAQVLSERRRQSREIALKSPAVESISSDAISSSAATEMKSTLDEEHRLSAIGPGAAIEEAPREVQSVLWVKRPDRRPTVPRRIAA
ncbi:MAG: YihY/virulence factor BrkB family protein [Pirellulales bacterium]